MTSPALPPTYRPEPRHIELGDAFYDVVAPARFPEHRLRWRNQRAAAEVGLDQLDDAAWVDHLARFRPLPQNLPLPLALRYHGHQFRHYNPDLGDGRGFLYAQLRAGPRLLDLGTKGSGTTPWSRGGDGRLTLQGAVRELLSAEMQEALGVPVSRVLSVVETGEALDRHDEPSPTRAAVMVRLQHSHIRYGTFQRLAYLRDKANLRTLVEHSVELHFPALAGEPDLPSALLAAAARAQARTVGAWMAAGYVHGVLNTDNMNITGESFDFGPWRFAPDLDPDFTAAYFDQNGLYSYGRQPEAVHWNLQQLAMALAQIGDPPALARALEGYLAHTTAAMAANLRWRLGLAPAGAAADQELLQVFTRVLRESRLPLDRVCFDWFGGGAAAARALAGPLGALYQRRWFAPLRTILEARGPNAQGSAPDAIFAQPQPCAMLIDEVRALWAAVADRDDWGPVVEKVAAVRRLGAALGEGPLVAAWREGRLWEDGLALDGLGEEPKGRADPGGAPPPSDAAAEELPAPTR
jgi:uncharacterized protein YdiU (UPF0061 family)